MKTKTTIMLPDGLLVAAKQRAAQERCTLGAFIERSLRHELAGASRSRGPKGRKIRWVTVPAGLPRGLDVRDRSAMHDWLRRPS
jgi:hypothetical protein